MKATQVLQHASRQSFDILFLASIFFLSSLFTNFDWNLFSSSSSGFSVFPGVLIETLVFVANFYLIFTSGLHSSQSAHKINGMHQC